jgi:glycosyltransferase involved in cell wall biosynthesis
MTRSDPPPSRPRIVYDMTFADKSLTGTRVYAQQLCRAVQETREVDVIALTAPRASQRWMNGNIFSGARNLLWLQKILPGKLASLRADVFHAPAFLGTLAPPCPMVVTVPDTIYRSFPGDYDYKWRLYARLLIGPSIQRAAAVITHSDFSKSQIATAYRVPRERIHVVPHGIAQPFKVVPDADAVARVKEKYGLRERYCLFVGASERRKNLLALVQAVAQLHARGDFAELQMALVGPRGSGWNQVQSLVTRERLQERVVGLGFVADEELPLLYAGAELFVFPSLMEGFGIPLLEAMASGTPIVATPCPPTPEVVGDAAYLAAGTDADALANAMARVLNDSELARRLRASGRARAERFSWQRAAQQTVALYRSVMEQNA